MMILVYQWLFVQAIIPMASLVSCVTIENNHTTSLVVMFDRGLQNRSQARNKKFTDILKKKIICGSNGQPFLINTLLITINANITTMLASMFDWGPQNRPRTNSKEFTNMLKKNKIDVDLMVKPAINQY